MNPPLDFELCLERCRYLIPALLWKKAVSAAFYAVFLKEVPEKVHKNRFSQRSSAKLGRASGSKTR
jgi:2-phosphoglycerate kinase